MVLRGLFVVRVLEVGKVEPRLGGGCYLAALATWPVRIPTNRPTCVPPGWPICSIGR